MIIYPITEEFIFHESGRFPRGWQPLVRSVLEQFSKDLNSTDVFIYSKFGHLDIRFARHLCPAGYLWEIAKNIEIESAHTCERCGSKDATLRTSATWWYTWCTECFAAKS